jgi:hypothetical protein
MKDGHEDSKADLEYGAGVAKALGIKAAPPMIAAD